MPFTTAKIIRLPDVDSTSNYAAKLLITSNPPEGTAIMARHQLGGRGQRGNAWEDEPGKNLLCSIILYPDFLNAANHFRLSQAVALAIVETIGEVSGLPTGIKWPNDIIAGDRKIAGILIESNWSGTQIQSAIVGIGINVNQVRFQIPWATSLATETGHELDVEEMFETLLESLYRQYRNLKNADPQVEHNYHDLLYRRDIPATYSRNGERFTGIIRGTDLSGKLIMDLETGERVVFSTHEVQMLY